MVNSAYVVFDCKCLSPPATYSIFPAIKTILFRTHTAWTMGMSTKVEQWLSLGLVAYQHGRSAMALDPEMEPLRTVMSWLITVEILKLFSICWNDPPILAIRRPLDATLPVRHLVWRQFHLKVRLLPASMLIWTHSADFPCETCCPWYLRVDPLTRRRWCRPAQHFSLVMVGICRCYSIFSPS